MSDYKIVLDKQTGQMKRVPANGIETPQIGITEDLPAIDTTDKEQVRKLLTDELWLIVGKNRGSISAIAAIREIWDRMDGKPAQSVQLDATVKTITVNASIEFIKPQLTIDNTIPDCVNKPLINHEK